MRTVKLYLKNGSIMDFPVVDDAFTLASTWKEAEDVGYVMTVGSNRQEVLVPLDMIAFMTNEIAPNAEGSERRQ